MTMVFEHLAEVAGVLGYTPEWCFYECGRVATTNDHIIPTENGGANCQENYVRACEPCNSDRKHTPIGTYLNRIGVHKQAPAGITNNEYRLREYGMGNLTWFTCVWCEQTLLTPRHFANPQKFCSASHKRKFERKRRPRHQIKETV